jgi:Fe-S-cluster containining protein
MLEEMSKLMATKEQRMLICAETCGSKCCKSTPPALTSEDIARINNFAPNDNWLKVVTKSERTYQVVEKRNVTTDCYFLSEENLCNVYDSRPLDCKLFPIFLKIKKNEKNSYTVKWLVWYCPLTEELGLETLLEEARDIVNQYLESNPQILFEYQTALYESGGYKKKHFMKEEIITINKRE